MPFRDQDPAAESEAGAGAHRDVVPVRELSPHHDIDPERDPDPPVADLDYEIDRPLGYEISLPNGLLIPTQPIQYLD